LKEIKEEEIGGSAFGGGEQWEFADSGGGGREDG
jgi:hypothetical protein